MLALNARRAVCGLLITGAVAGTAVAATPDAGTVSASSPKVTWTGETTGSYFTRVPTAVSADDSVPCQAPSCDTFALKVETKANLTVAADIGQPSDNPGAVTIRVRKPDGSVVVGSSGADEVSEGKPYKVQIKGADVGDYTVEYWNNFYDGPITYSGYAELAVPKPAAPAPVDVPAPTTAPAPTTETTQAIDVTVAGAKAKGKKASAKVTVSRAVTGITATLKKGAKVVATGTRGATSGTATIALKAKKALKKGTYALTVTATDGKTSTAKTVKVKVK